MTFYKCKIIKRVIFADTVIQIERYAFGWCERLASVTRPNNLEFIGWGAFEYCKLSSVFVPQKCKEIQCFAFQKNKKLTIFNVPQDTRIACPNVFFSTILFKKNPYSAYQTQKFLHWIKNINSEEKATLHRIFCSYELTVDDIVEKANLQETGMIAFKVENDIGITPSVYLKENHFADITEMEII